MRALTHTFVLQTGADIRSAYEDYLNASLLNITERYIYQLCYDTVWTLVKALNHTMTG